MSVTCNGKYRRYVVKAQCSLYGDHKRCCAKINLCNDIETNPGPPMNNIDPTLTVKAPYSQGYITIFGANAGQQCVAMSLCALIYNNIKGINPFTPEGLPIDE